MTDMQGWCAFQCDECGAQWQSASRDHASPSGEDCEKCGAWVFPHLHWPDPTLQCDEFGNLLRAYEGWAHQSYPKTDEKRGDSHTTGGTNE